MTPIKSTLKRIGRKIETRMYGAISPIGIEHAHQESHVIFDEELYSMPTLYEYNSSNPTIFSAYEALVPKSQVFCIRNAMCVASCEEVFTEEHKVVREFTTTHNNQMVGKSQMRIKTSKRKRYFGKVLHMSLGGLEDNYYHFNVEFLARWYIFNLSGIKVDYIIWPMRTSFQREFAELLMLDKTILLNADDSLVQAETLVVPTLINNYKTVELNGFIFYHKLWIPSWISQAYESVQQKAGSQFTGKEGPARIYISRRNARCRRIVNEQELFQELEKYGFVKLYLEDLSVVEQLSKFRDARAIIAPHGAGLVNMSYAMQKLKILELYSKDYFDPSFRIHANTLGHQYDFLIGETAPNRNLNPQEEDIIVNVSKVGRWLKRNL